MLKDHIIGKFEYCENYDVAGYVSRIVRAGQDPFGGPNEVTLDIINACLLGEDVDKAIDEFFEKNYPAAAKEVRDSFRIEKAETEKLEAENLTDFKRKLTSVIHLLKKMPYTVFQAPAEVKNGALLILTVGLAMK